MLEITLELLTKKVNAGNLEDKIADLIVKKQGSKLNRNVPYDRFWGLPLEDQIKTLADKWTDPKSNGDGVYWFICGERKENKNWQVA